jgi:chemotaxis protein CheX
MDVNMINPVLSAFASIIPQIGFSEIARKGIRMTGPNLENTGILVNVNVVGPLKGSILLGMNMEGAMKFASKMMMGMEVTEMNSMAMSAISEMSNMVCANACILYNEVGIHGLDISPPTMLMGNGGKVMLSTQKIIVVTFMVDNEIEVAIYVSLIE